MSSSSKFAEQWCNVGYKSFIHRGKLYCLNTMFHKWQCFVVIQHLKNVSSHLKSSFFILFSCSLQLTYMKYEVWGLLMNVYGHCCWFCFFVGGSRLLCHIYLSCFKFVYPSSRTIEIMFANVLKWSKLWHLLAHVLVFVSFDADFLCYSYFVLTKYLWSLHFTCSCYEQFLWASSAIETRYFDSVIVRRLK